MNNLNLLSKSLEILFGTITVVLLKKMLEFKTNQEKCSVQDRNAGLKQKSQENRAFLCPFLPAFAIF